MLAEAHPKEFCVQVVDMMQSPILPNQSRAMVAFCNFLSKSKRKEPINLDGFSSLLPILLSFLPVDKNKVMKEEQTYLAGAGCAVCL
jgi:hypothetical protein